MHVLALSVVHVHLLADGGAPVASSSLQAFAIAAASSWLIPILVDLVTKAHAPTRAKTLIATALAALAGVLPTVVFTSGERWSDYLIAVGLALANTQAAHRVLQGAGDPVQARTGNFGLSFYRRGATAALRINRVRVTVVNQTTKANVTNADVAKWVRACAAQAHEFARYWGISSPSVTFAKTAPAPNRTDCVIVILDNADQAGALGYHDESSDGVTYGRVFALDCLQANVSVSSCLSHEILEALADLNVDRWVDAPDGREWALEVSDPVESDTYTDAAGVELSDYVLPSFFDDQGAPPFDRLDKLHAPFSLSRGGYAIVRSSTGNPTQIWGDKAHYDATEGWRHDIKDTPLSRTAHRLTKRRKRAA